MPPTAINFVETTLGGYHSRIHVPSTYSGDNSWHRLIQGVSKRKLGGGKENRKKIMLNGVGDSALTSHELPLAKEHRTTGSTSKKERRQMS